MGAPVSPAARITYPKGKEWTYLATLPLRRPADKSVLLAAFDRAAADQKDNDGHSMWVVSLPSTTRSKNIPRECDRILRFTDTYARGRSAEISEAAKKEIRDDKAFKDAVRRYWFTYTVSISPRGVIRIQYRLPLGYSKKSELLIKNSLPFALFPLVESMCSLVDDKLPFGVWFCIISDDYVEKFRQQWIDSIDSVAERCSQKVLLDVMDSIHHDFSGTWWRRSLAPWRSLTARKLVSYSKLVHISSAHWARAKQQVYHAELSLNDLDIDIRDVIPWSENRHQLHVADKAWAHCLQRLDSMAQFMGIFLGLLGIFLSLGVAFHKPLFESIGWWSIAIAIPGLLALTGIYKSAMAHASMLSHYLSTIDIGIYERQDNPRAAWRMALGSAFRRLFQRSKPIG